MADRLRGPLHDRRGLNGHAPFKVKVDDKFSSSMVAHAAWETQHEMEDLRGDLRARDLACSTGVSEV